MSYLSSEIAKYRDDPVLFVKDFGIVGQFPAFQEDVLRKIYAFSGAAGSERVIIHGRIQTVPCRMARPSRGWRRHVRRTKAARR